MQYTEAKVLTSLIIKFCVLNNYCGASPTLITLRTCELTPPNFPSPHPPQFYLSVRISLSLYIHTHTHTIVCVCVSMYIYILHVYF